MLRVSSQLYGHVMYSVLSYCICRSSCLWDRLGELRSRAYGISQAGRQDVPQPRSSVPGEAVIRSVRRTTSCETPESPAAASTCSDSCACAVACASEAEAVKSLVGSRRQHGRPSDIDVCSSTNADKSSVTEERHMAIIKLFIVVK